MCKCSDLNFPGRVLICVWIKYCSDFTRANASSSSKILTNFEIGRNDRFRYRVNSKNALKKIVAFCSKLCVVFAKMTFIGTKTILLVN